MTKRSNQIPPALKHGIYSALSLLPGEDRAEFEEFRQGLFDEIGIGGRCDEELASNLAQLMWRRANLSIYAIAARARAKNSALYAGLRPKSKWGDDWTRGLLMQPQDEYEEETRSPEELRALRKQADEKAEAELGIARELVELGDTATLEHLEKELDIIDRLDAMIDRCIKRLLMVRGLKSMSVSSEAPPARQRLKKVA